MGASKVLRLATAVMVGLLWAGSAAAQTEWMQPRVRVWYFGGVDGGSGVISSDAAEAYLFQSVAGTSATVVHHSALTSWTVPQLVNTGTYQMPDMGPVWIHPQRLPTLRIGESWKGQRILDVDPQTYTQDTFLAHLPYSLLVARALFGLQPQRLIYRVTYQLGLVSTGDAYFDAETGLLLYHQAVWGSTKMFFILAEINYDFATRRAFAEDAGPHAGFLSVANEVSVGGMVDIKSMTESRYGSTVQTWTTTYRYPPNTPLVFENYAFFGETPLVRHIGHDQASSVPIDQWPVLGTHLWWWVPPSVTGALALSSTAGSIAPAALPAMSINVLGVQMTRASLQPLTYTAPTNPAPQSFHFSSLTFDANGFLTVFSALDPSSGLDVRPGAALFQNLTRMDGPTYFAQHMQLPALSPPAITSLYPAAGPTVGGTSVTIGGANFVAGGTTVTIGGVPATAVVVQSPTSLTCTTPPGAVGSHDVVVATIAGQATAAGAFSYLAGIDVTAPADPAQPVSVSLPVAGGLLTATFTGVTTSGTFTIAPLPAPTPPVASMPFLPGSSLFPAAQGLTFATATVCLPYAPADVAAAGSSEESLMVWLQPPGKSTWVDVSSMHDTTGDRVCATMTELSRIVIAAATQTTLPVRRYLAEGATSTFFDTTIALVNPSPGATANTLLRFQRSDTTTRVRYVSVPPLGRRTVTVKSVPEMAQAEFSTAIESDQPVVVDRTMSWDGRGYGSHAETSVAAPATTWYLAEGATHSGFNLFYLVQNPHPTDAAQVLVRYLLPSGMPLEKVHTVPPHSRYNIWVNLEEIPAGSGQRPLAAIDVSAVLSSQNGVPVIVERAMYLDRQGLLFGAGHEGAGITAPATRWFLAEGATGAYFDLFVLVANPAAVDAPITATFLLPDGTTIARQHVVAANTRFNIWVDLEDSRLADTAVSTIIESTSGVPIIVERAMWWPGPTSATWAEAHDSAGSTATGELWALAEGEQGGPRAVETYILVANTSATDGRARVTLVFEDDTTAQQEFTLPANSRVNVNVGADFPQAMGRRFGAIVESLGATPARIVVERAMYSDAAGVHWAAGTNAVATRLR